MCHSIWGVMNDIRVPTFLLNFYPNFSRHFCPFSLDWKRSAQISRFSRPSGNTVAYFARVHIPFCALPGELFHSPFRECSQFGKISHLPTEWYLHGHTPPMIAINTLKTNGIHATPRQIVLQEYWLTAVDVILRRNKSHNKMESLSLKRKLTFWQKGQV